jgi:PTH1 family peptidyl-tRNA hydrolase
MVVEELAAHLGASFNQEKFQGEIASGVIGGEKVLLVKPLTFMNVSGRCLGPLAHFYKVEAEDILVVHDELDMPFGKLQLKKGGGSGGHNGLKSLSEAFGHSEYARLRFGIDKPSGPNAKERVPGYVLSAFSKDESGALPEFVKQARDVCEAWAQMGLAAAMNRYNRK